MIMAGIIALCYPSEVKAISLTILTQKAHEANGFTLDKIWQLVNNQLAAVGNSVAFIVLPHTLHLAPTNKSKQK